MMFGGQSQPAADSHGLSLTSSLEVEPVCPLFWIMMGGQMIWVLGLGGFLLRSVVPVHQPSALIHTAPRR